MPTLKQTVQNMTDEATKLHNVAMWNILKATCVPDDADINDRIREQGLILQRQANKLMGLE